MRSSLPLLVDRGEAAHPDTTRGLLHYDAMQCLQEGRKRVGVIGVEDTADRQLAYSRVIDLERNGAVTVELSRDFTKRLILKCDLAPQPRDS